MTLTIRIISVLVLILCIFSCKKDNDSTPPKQRLSKLIHWNNGNSGRLIVTTEFTYDDQNRVVEMATLGGDSVNGEIKSTKLGSLKFYYNGNGKNPYRTVGPMPYHPGDTAEIFHTYNSNGSLAQDSMGATAYASKSIRNYFYNSGSIIVESDWDGNITKDSFLVADNNLSEAYLYLRPNAQFTGYKLTHDDKINPISELNIASLASVISIRGSIYPSYLAPGLCRNNITDYIYGYSSGPGSFTRYNDIKPTWFYNEYNLPEEFRYNNNGIPYSIDFTVKFYYEAIK